MQYRNKWQEWFETKYEKGQPTGHLRWLTTGVLQQEWVNDAGNIAWIDVPVVQEPGREQTNAPVG